MVLHLNCTALHQSESSNFVMYIINEEKDTVNYKPLSEKDSRTAIQL